MGAHTPLASTPHSSILLQLSVVAAGQFEHYLTIVDLSQDEWHIQQIKILVEGPVAAQEGLYLLPISQPELAVASEQLRIFSLSAQRNAVYPSVEVPSKQQFR